jgi:biotin carboxyl carrier protein
VHVAPGEHVGVGQPLVTVEAMKMEHAVVAPTGGLVARVRVRVGETVTLDEVLVEVTEPVGDGADGEPGGVGS